MSGSEDKTAVFVSYSGKTLKGVLARWLWQERSCRTLPVRRVERGVCPNGKNRIRRGENPPFYGIIYYNLSQR